MVDDYNTHMGGVDVSDQLVRYYGYPHRLSNDYNNYNLHRFVKWWKRVFHHPVRSACPIVNANILCNELSGTPINQLDFRVSIISSLLEGRALNLPQRHYAPTMELPTRLSERPFPIKLILHMVDVHNVKFVDQGLKLIINVKSVLKFIIQYFTTTEVNLLFSVSPGYVNISLCLA